MSAFLTFVVEKTLEGREQEVKETSIGIEVYGRGDGFDPQTDSIVRVEASRLRSKLRDYYLEEGREDGWRIEMPKGTYVPEFRQMAPAEPEVRQPGREVERRDEPPLAREEPVRRWWSGLWLMGSAAILLVVAAWMGWRDWKLGAPVQSRRVAVLPFEDLSESKDLEYFCDGLAEEVIDSLSRLEGVSVLARSSSFRFRGSLADARQIGQQLQVDRILTGSVRRAGDSFRVSAQLVDARTGVAVWSNRFDRKMGNELRVQEDISRAVAEALELTMKAPAGGVRQAVSAEAHNLFLKGRYYYWKSTPEDEARAREFFEQAIQISPQFAPAYAALADTLASLPLRGRKASEAEIERARYAADRAVALDPGFVDGLLAKAHIARTLDYDWAEAEKIYQRAVRLHRGAARPHNSYGVLLSMMGKLEAADVELREALRLDPLAMQVHTNLVLNLYRQGRYEEAAAQARRGSAIDPNYRNIYSPWAASLAELGRFDEALKTIGALRQLGGGTLADNHLGIEGYIHARAGDRAKALAALAELERRESSRYVPKAAMADVLLGLGENNRALDRMEEALANREVLLVGLLVSPHSRAVAQEERFKRLREKVAKQ
jgi:serine/threonine-protein kinase